MKEVKLIVIGEELRAVRKNVHSMDFCHFNPSDVNLRHKDSLLSFRKGEYTTSHVPIEHYKVYNADYEEDVYYIVSPEVDYLLRSRNQVAIDKAVEGVVRTLKAKHLSDFYFIQKTYQHLSLWTRLQMAWKGQLYRGTNTPDQKVENA